jgi:ribosome-binding ATPase YchF (GTP1/OBG family)
MLKYIGSNIAENRYPAFLHLTDIAGLIKGASEGAGLGNAFLSHIQAVDGIFHMVRAFDSTEVVHVSSSLVQKPLRVALSVCVFLVGLFALFFF